MEETIKIQFEKELKLLLKKYNAYLYMDDIGYGHHIDYTIKININEVLGAEGNLIRENQEIDLGNHYDGKIK